MAEATVLVDDAQAVRTITLNRPDKLNSFNEKMHAELRQAFAGAADDGVRAVVLTGAGKGFCAGQDLSDRVQGEDGKAPDLGSTIDTLWNPLIRTIRGLRKPVVCAVNGVAAGAGANIALVLRHRSGGPVGALHPAVLPPGPRARCRRHALPAAAGRRGARQGAGIARRPRSPPSRPRAGA